MAIVYVLDMNKKPLMPTERCGHVRYLLKQGIAKVVNTYPFTIQLLYPVTDNRYNKLIMGINPGRTNIGVSVIKENGVSVFEAELVTRNKDIPKLMFSRKIHRNTSRRQERIRRQRRAIASNTVFKTGIEKKRLLPGYSNPIVCKYINNSEARFNNRARKKGWLTPTANHCVQTHLNLVKKVMKFLPVTDIVIEVNKFDFQSMNNPYIKAWEYSKGTLFGYKDKYDYISNTQNHKCLLCGGNIEHYHHIVPKSKNGSDTHENLAGLCSACHHKVHADKSVKAKLETLKKGILKQYGGFSILNISIPFIIKELVCLIGDEHLFYTNPSETMVFRNSNNIVKTYANDAYCIAHSAISSNVISLSDVYVFKQYRRHDRSFINRLNIDRKYYLDDKLVATNRHKRGGQESPSLEEFRASLGSNAEQIISKLIVKEHKPMYNNKNRLPNGSLVMFDNDTYLVVRSCGKRKTGSETYAVQKDEKRTNRILSKLKVIKQNTGIVFLPKNIVKYGKVV